MIRRLTAALVIAMMLAAPGAAFAAGPDKTKALAILEQIAQHACEAAQRVADAWGLKIGQCIEEKPPAEEIPIDRK